MRQDGATRISRQVPALCPTDRQLGKEAKAYLNGTRRLSMDFRQASPKKPQPAKRGVKRKSDQFNLGFAQSTVNPLARQRSLQEIRAAEQAFDDSPWPDDAQLAPSDDPIDISDGENANYDANAAAQIVSDGDDEPLAKKKCRFSQSRATPVATERKKKSCPKKKTSETRTDTLFASQEASPVRRKDAGTPVDQLLRSLKKLIYSVIEIVSSAHRGLTNSIVQTTKLPIFRRKPSN